MGEAPASTPPPYPHLCPHRRPRRCSQREMRAWVLRHRTVPRHRRPAAVTPSRPCHHWRGGPGRGGWGSDAPCRPCATRTGPRVQVVQGAPGGAALLLQAPRGAPSTGASGGRCATAHANRDGGTVCALPPPPPGGRGGGGSDSDNGEEATQGSGAALAPTGRSGSLRRGHGRAEGADT